jgi:hypothetical protein
MRWKGPEQVHIFFTDLMIRACPHEDEQQPQQTCEQE